MKSAYSFDPSTFPSFSTIQAQDIEPRLQALLTTQRQQLADLLAAGPPYTWESLAAPLADMDNTLHRFWAPFSHLHAVCESEERRAAYNACLPLLSEYHTERMQNEALFHAIQALRADPTFEQLTPAQQKVIDNELRDFRLSGIDLPPANKARFATLLTELSVLGAKFSENLLDATMGFTITLSDSADLAGLPEETRSLAADNARKRNQSGWVLTLDAPCFSSVMKYLDNRALREKMYSAYVTRASDQGPCAGKWDNSPIMRDIIQKRRELANLVGFDSYAHFALATRMAKTPTEVMAFLNDLVERSRSFGQQEADHLRQFANESGLSGPLEAWDVAYYSEKLQQKSFSISDEEVRPYFQAEKVLDGIFTIVGKLFGIQFVEKKDVDTWHPDVRFFAVSDADGHCRGYLYTDLYARERKREGAWMDDCQGRLRLSDGQLQLPVAFLTCNFIPPVNNAPSLLTHDDVQTAFHELGHCLHHLLTRVEESGVSGISGVPWDAVEFPSQFLEHWCWDFKTLQQISAHIETNQPLSESLFNKMRSARHFQSGLAMLRQLEFALFDFELHLEPTPFDDNTVQTILDRVRNRVSVLPKAPFNRFQHGFSHIFAGGYAAGYYSYKWAEVLSSDAFSLFEEKGIDDAETGRSFLHHILEQGGVYDPMQLFVRFRGRKPTIDALLRHLGLENPVTAQ